MDMSVTDKHTGGGHMMFYDRESRDRIKNFAKSLRKKTTAHEYFVRSHIKRAGEKRVLRQHVVGKCIIDLALPFRNLLIEVDGESHEPTRDKDNRRDKWLTSLGFIVLRVRNEEVMEAPESIMEKIRAFPVSEQNKKKFYMATRAAKKVSYWVEASCEGKTGLTGKQHHPSPQSCGQPIPIDLWNMAPYSTEIH